MIGKIFRLTVAAALLAHSFGAFADNAYRLVGVTRVYSTSPSAAPDLELPVNPAFSSVLTRRADSFSLNYDGTTPEECSVKVQKQSPFSFDSAPLGNADKLNTFLQATFHTSSNDWTTMYLLQDVTAPNCAALRFAKIYASKSELFLLKEPFLYMFRLQEHPFKDANKGFDCGLAKSNVEHLICGDPKLKKLDAQVSYGYVLLQRKYSKEISYQDPVRIGQIDWVVNVRNKCTTADCLAKAYSSRVNYIKTKVSDSYPSYPEEEND
ncbi:hypothetical protein PQQ51_32470 [Paraburkholderia xenovorans]|uniref:hypothetical protein n=1 Tax=Paraburkholderia xenovorans TaxID=36873 RepID=UPI0038BB02FB